MNQNQINNRVIKDQRNIIDCQNNVIESIKYNYYKQEQKIKTQGEIIKILEELLARHEQLKPVKQIKIGRVFIGVEE